MHSKPSLHKIKLLAETVRRQQGISHERIAEDRLWNKRPDGIAFKMPADSSSGVICLLEFKRMSDVTSHYIVRAKSVAMAQYDSLRSALGNALQRSGWVVHQRSFIAGARSLNETELKENLEYFQVPSASLEPARPDSGRSDHGEAPARPARDPMPPLINSLTTWQPSKIRKRKERGSKERGI